MSFGFSIGDFIAVIQLANKVRKEFSGAPVQFNAISHEVRSLSIVLQDIEVQLSSYEIDARQLTDLVQLRTTSEDVLHDLEAKVAKYHDIECSGKSLRKSAMRTWKRLRWEPNDIREIRDRITSTLAALNAFLGRVSNQTLFDIKPGVIQLTQQVEDTKRLEVLDWLAVDDGTSQQVDAISRRQEGTGQWLLESDVYQHWVQTRNKTLFCPGIPGAGKTICSAIVIEDLASRSQIQEDIGLAYVYCAYGRQQEQTVDNLLLALLRQLSDKRSSLPDPVKLLFERNQERKTRPSTREIVTTLQSVAAAYSTVFIVVDALDECEPSCCKVLVDKMFKIQAASGANLFTTSRPLDVAERFKGSMSIEIRANEDDVREYIDKHMMQLPHCVQKNPKVQEEIKVAIVGLVEGMFLLAQHHLQSLTEQPTIRAIRKALERLPQGKDSNVYDDAYDEAMARIDKQSKATKILAKKALFWVLCAKKPLTPLELQHALVIEEGETILDEENIPEIKHSSHLVLDF